MHRLATISPFHAAEFHSTEPHGAGSLRETLLEILASLAWNAC